MFAKLLLLFIGIPLIEMMILIKLGQLWGFWPTLALVVGAGFFGAAAARIQGWHALFTIQQELREGRMPAESLVDALLILAAGIFLITPGVLTDLVGIVLLIPWTRYWVKRFLRRQFERTIRGSRGEIR